ncbi:MAG: sigma-54-dependent Fis family transcriptional regulator [Spirochaetales bacterium]|nr:sigma-54-dependent Fis family transcriptional regulator [Spirochaetales bacterium]
MGWRNAVSDITVLCVDDEQYIVDSIRDFISGEYACTACTDPVQSLEYLRQTPVDILVVDYRMAGISGLDLLREARKLDAYMVGILLTAYADKNLLANVLNDSLVYKALEKPLDLQRLKFELDESARQIRDKRENQEKLRDIYRFLSGAGDDGFGFIGKDGDLADLWRTVERIAPTDENVLVTGETGTGKDVIARQLHAMSTRADKPFIKINCGAIPAPLIESELFGHEKGAFSGADRRKFGKIELAHRGTLFLDEVGELPVDLQTRLLHVVEDKVVERVGGTQPIRVDFRLVSATNRALETAGAEEFRRDLFYRIATVHLKLPDLASRQRDLPVHILSLVERNARLFGKIATRVSPDAMRLLCSYSWPGNIRELDNVIKRALLMKSPVDDELTLVDMKAVMEAAVATTSGAFDQIARDIMAGSFSFSSTERELLQRVLTLSGGRIMEAARITGISKDRFYRLQDKPPT